MYVGIFGSRNDGDNRVHDGAVTIVGDLATSDGDVHVGYGESNHCNMTARGTVDISGDFTSDGGTIRVGSSRGANNCTGDDIFGSVTVGGSLTGASNVDIGRGFQGPMNPEASQAAFLDVAGDLGTGDGTTDVGDLCVACGTSELVSLAAEVFIGGDLLNSSIGVGQAAEGGVANGVLRVEGSVVTNFVVEIEIGNGGTGDFFTAGGVYNYDGVTIINGVLEVGAALRTPALTLVETAHFAIKAGGELKLHVAAPAAYALVSASSAVEVESGATVTVILDDEAPAGDYDLDLLAGNPSVVWPDGAQLNVGLQIGRSSTAVGNFTTAQVDVQGIDSVENVVITTDASAATIRLSFTISPDPNDAVLPNRGVLLPMLALLLVYIL